MTALRREAVESVRCETGAARDSKSRNSAHLLLPRESWGATAKAQRWPVEAKSGPPSDPQPEQRLQSSTHKDYIVPVCQ